MNVSQRIWPYSEFFIKSFSLKTPDKLKESSKNTQQAPQQQETSLSIDIMLENVVVNPAEASTQSSVQAIKKQAEGLEKPADTTMSRPEKQDQIIKSITIVNANIGGSTGAAKVADNEGNEFVRKQTSEKISAGHLRSEYHANKAYAVLGAKVPEVSLYHQVNMSVPNTSDKPIMLAKFIDNTVDIYKYLNDPSVSTEEKIKREVIVQKEAQKHFVADCLLANWDVVGSELDNMRINPETKELFRVDNGSAMNYRAQGGLKTAAEYGNTVDELNHMRTLNPATKRFFENISNDEIIRQIDEIMPKREAFLAAIPEDQKEIMSKRLDNLEVQKQMLMPSSKKPKYNSI